MDVHVRRNFRAQNVHVRRFGGRRPAQPGSLYIFAQSSANFDFPHSFGHRRTRMSIVSNPKTPGAFDGSSNPLPAPGVLSVCLFMPLQKQDWSTTGSFRRYPPPTELGPHESLCSCSDSRAGCCYVSPSGSSSHRCSSSRRDSRGSSLMVVDRQTF